MLVVELEEEVLDVVEEGLDVVEEGLDVGDVDAVGVVRIYTPQSLTAGKKISKFDLS